MNFNQALELHRAIFKISHKTPGKPPKISIFNVQGGFGGFQNSYNNYVLWIKAFPSNAKFLAYLESIAKKHRLRIKEVRGRIALYSSETWDIFEN